MGDSQATKGMYIPRPIDQYAEQFTGDIDSAKSIRDWVKVIDGAVAVYNSYTDFKGTKSFMTIHDRSNSTKLNPGDWVVGDVELQKVVILSDELFKIVYMPKEESPWP